MNTDNTAASKGWNDDSLLDWLNDLICFDFILEIQNRLKNQEAQGYITAFLKLLAPVYTYELLTTLINLGWIDKANLPRTEYKQIQAEREHAVKRRFATSSRSVRASESMGLSFLRSHFDLNIVVSGETLMDTNFESYVDNIKDTDHWNALFLMPRSIIASICQKADLPFDHMQDTLSTEIDGIAHHAEERLDLERYIYSVAQLFRHARHLNESDRYFILYRYRLVSSIFVMEEIMPRLEIVVGENTFFDTKKFFRKYKALVIDIIGNELSSLNTCFATNLKNAIDHEIKNKGFFKLNRRIRDNLHYTSYDELTDDELAIIDEYQDIYLKIIKAAFEKCLYVCLDKQTRKHTQFLRLCQNKGMSTEEINKHFLRNFIKFLCHGDF